MKKYEIKVIFIVFVVDVVSYQKQQQHTPPGLLVGPQQIVDNS